MSILTSSFAGLSDTELLSTITRLATSERHATVQLIASLAELDARRLYLGQGFSSMFVFCTQALHLSEHAAYNRIEAARAARRFPTILDRLADGSITLTTVCLLAAHLTAENHRDALDAARHRSKREVELLVARLRPLPPVPAAVRKLPAASAPPTVTVAVSEQASDALAPASGPTLQMPAAPRAGATGPAAQPRRRPAVVAPLTVEHYKLQVTVSRETVATLRRVQELMRHTIPDGDPAAIVDRALTLLLTHLMRTKQAATDRPRAGRTLTSGSRQVPAAVRRAVWTRDRSQCAFVSPDGRRCQERGFLELHHTVPYAAGGDATVATIELRCRAHNAYEAELDFGPAVRQRAHERHAARSTAST
jgi:hypothetical protein